jgi:PAS domain S-box-containing protein
MGGKITQPAKLWDLARARLLRETLRRGATPTLASPEISDQPAAVANRTSWTESDREVQKTYLEQLLEYAPEAVSILDTNFVVVRINEEFTRTFGFTPGESIGKRIDTLLVPPDRTAETQFIAESLKKGEKITLETKRRRKGGALVDVSIAAAPVTADGAVIAHYIVYRDISEQKRAEALSSALYRIAERSNSAVDLQQFFASIHNILGELMYARNFYIALFDRETSTLSFPYFVDEEDPAPEPQKPSRGLTEYVLRTSEPVLCTPQLFDELMKQGEVELVGAPSVDWLGVPLKTPSATVGVLAVQSYSDNVRFGERDKEILTFVAQQVASAIEHKRYEEALRRPESRYRSVVQSAVYGIYRASVLGQFLDVNPALIGMLGYESAEELLALDPRHDLFQDPHEQDRLLKEYRQRGRLDGVEVKWRRKDGNVITVRLNGRAVSSPEEPNELLEVFAEDITERRELEAQFRQAQKMEAVGRLAGGVAHDFNNLLMVISGYTEVLLEQATPSDSHYQKVLSIQQAADRATTLTRQLLAFSRKQLMELKVVDVNSIVEDMERLLRPLIGEDIELATRLGPGVGHTRADAGQLEQVLMNLVVNAKDAMPEGGRITVQTSDVTVEESDRREHTFLEAGRYVLLSVTDTGNGMDEETKSRIFEPFFTTKEKGKGTGLGLSTVYGIIKQSGGYIVTQSELGHGTTFRIYLPRVEEAGEQSEASRNSTQAAGGSETVLLVEDEESVRELVRHTLVSKGYSVLEAEHGEAGLEVAANYSNPIEILITDVVMPGMGGRALAQEMLKAHPKMKVLFLSGYTEDAVIQGVLEPGTAFLQKPFTLQALSKKVREVLSS